MGSTYMLQFIFSNIIRMAERQKKSMAFAVPIVWREPTNHLDDGYFCWTPPIKAGLSMKKIQIPNNLPPAIRPILLSYSVPVLTSHSWVRTKKWSQCGRTWTWFRRKEWSFAQIDSIGVRLLWFKTLICQKKKRNF